MSYYPPAPIPFASNTQVTPPTLPYKPGLQRYPFQQLSRAPRFHAQSPTKGLSPASQTNTYSFNTNTQGEAMPVANSATYSTQRVSYGGQMHQTPLPPPPPFPPVPIPLARSSSYVAQPSSQLLAGSLMHSPHGILPSIPLDSYVHSKEQGTISEIAEIFAPASPELEDGELNDRDGQSSINISELSMPSSRRSMVLKHNEGKSPPATLVNGSVNTAPPKIANSVEDSSTATDGNRALSTQDYPPPKQNGPANNYHSKPSLTSESGDITMRQAHSVNEAIEKTPSVRAQSVNKIEEEAKVALRDLHLQDIKFADIVNEGFSPDILRQFYKQFSIQITPPESMHQQTTIQQLRATETSTGRTHDAATVYDQGPQQTPPSSSHPATNELTNDKTPILTDEGNGVSGHGTVLAAKVTKNSVSSPLTNPKTMKTSNNILLGKSVSAKASDSKVLDRKQYIARMLAAKTSKPAVSSSVNVSKATSNDAKLMTQPGTSDQLPTTSPAPAPSEAAVSPRVPLESRTVNVDAEAKRRTQTDLARQKMEALKTREMQQLEKEAVANSRESMTQILPPTAQKPLVHSSESHMPAFQPSVPIRQEPYFSPTIQKPPFSIPGLFMTSDTQESIDSSRQFASTPPKTKRDSTRSMSMQHALPPQETDLRTKSLSRTETAPTTDPTMHKAVETLPAVTAAPAATHRKRQTAADFIDSPSVRIKRALGQQENSSVIIDISEDDSMYSADEDRLEIRDGMSKRLPTVEPASSKQGSVKDVPPLTDFLPRRRSVLDVSRMTPPIIASSGQAKESEGLKSKEIEIELMNRKIAELEQRIKAKQGTSRAQTPNSPSKVSVEPALGGDVQVTNHATPIDSKSPNSRSQDFNVRHQSSSTAEARESATEEQLIAAQLLQEAELAQIKRSPIMKVPQAVTASSEALQKETMQSDQEEKQILQDEEEKSCNEEQLQFESRESSPLRNIDHQRLEEEETNTHDAAKERTREIEDMENQAIREQEYQSLKEAGAEQIREKQNQILEEQRRRRIAEIESGLPILDAEVARTSEKLESLRRDTVELEVEVQKGVQGRQLLMKELENLSHGGSTRSSLRPTTLSGESNTQQPPLSQETEAFPRLSSPTEVVRYSASPLQVEIASMDQKLLPTPQQATTVNTALCSIAKDLPSDEMIEKDVMDLSRSDVDEGEVSEYSPEPPVQARDLSCHVDGDDTYEPILQDIQPQQDIQMTDATPPCQEHSVSNPSQNDNSTAETAHVAEIPSRTTNAQEKPGSPIESRSPLAGSDLDDYEPPEPDPSAERAMLPSNDYKMNLKAPLSPPDTEAPDFAQHYANRQNTTAAPNSSLDHFIPYDSPLKQFKAYRFHPEYLNGVSNGFRSLTYSHAIDPAIPLCRYELGGVCNDKSCSSQHFRNMGLSDDKILVDLGARPESSSQENSKAFGDGLKQVIHDIRNRKIRDFNVVASEITAYRSKFLGDASKVLPL